MTKHFEINGTEYTVASCRAIAGSVGDTEYQQALYIAFVAESGEKFEHLLFDYSFPETAEDFEYLLDNAEAAYWSSYSEDLDTMILDDPTI